MNKIIIFFIALTNLIYSQQDIDKGLLDKYEIDFISRGSYGDKTFFIEECDFCDDLKYISIGGNRVKSKRNRIVPVPEFIREQLSVGKKENNIFANTTIEFNEDYFKTLWGRFKRVSKLVEQDQTLYSFRHSGAIEIFKRTGSITKLQKAMGHSSINVSLTYLRGLEIPELNEEDMPMI
jgi:integrase